MNVHCINFVSEYNHSDDSELNDREIDFIESLGVVELWYWYKQGDYEGSGNALALGDNGLYYVESLSHCSCYGPVENFQLTDPYPSLEAILNSGSADYLSNIMPLLKAASGSEGFNDHGIDI
jgi:hypothetical protein